MRFLSIGECMAELAPAEAMGTYRLGFAGDTFNTAWYLARLRPDAEVSFFSKIGTDAMSLQMRREVEAAGIATRHLAEDPTRTIGLYVIAVTEGERSFSYWRGQSAARHLADDPERLAQAMVEADMIYFSGITLAILDPLGRDALIAAARSARSQGKRVAFDPNLRPRLWESAAAMTDWVEKAAAVCDVALPSFEDDAAAFGDATPEVTVERYAEAGAAEVFVKNGGGPVTYWADGQHGTVHVHQQAHPVDTTAAGDSFNAYILAAEGRAQPVEATIAEACSLAGQVVMQRGALVPVQVA